MMKFNREEGLTLIELLITIAVLAIVAAIAVPVVTNVVNSTEDRAVAQTQSDVNDFVAKYNNTGAYSFDGTNTFEGYVDLNGNGSADSGEKIEELVVDTSTFTISVTDGGDTLGVPADSTAVDFDVTPDDSFTIAEAN